MACKVQKIGESHIDVAVVVITNWSLEPTQEQAKDSEITDFQASRWEPRGALHGALLRPGEETTLLKTLFGWSKDFGYLYL